MLSQTPHQRRQTNGHQNKIKKCSASMVIKKRQSKITMSYNYLPTEMAKIKTLRILNIGKNAQQFKLLKIVSGNVKWPNFLI